MERRWAVLIGIAAFAWVGALVATFHSIWRYSTQPAVQPRPPATWPAGAADRWDGRPHLVVFAHPKCSCTRATMAELARLQGATGRVDAAVWFWLPAGASVDYAEGSTWAMASRIPRTAVRIDRDGAEAQRFSAAASGLVVYYDAQGQLRFAGGITPSRGHEGDSPGRREVLALLDGLDPIRGTSSLYGCTLSPVTP